MRPCRLASAWDMKTKSQNTLISLKISPQLLVILAAPIKNIYIYTTKFKKKKNLAQCDLAALPSWITPTLQTINRLWFSDHCGGGGYHYNRAVTRKCIKSAWSADLSPNDDIPFSRLFPRRPMYDNLYFVYHMYYITYKIKSKVQSDLAALLLSGHSCCYPYMWYI